MQHLPIWFTRELHPDIVETALVEMNSLLPKLATMGDKGDHNDTKTRNTTVRFAEITSPMCQQLNSFGIMANAECKWDYVIDTYEAVQYASYGVGQHYHWHTDTFTLAGNASDRKITVVCLLSDPTEFDGGQFEVRLYNDYVAPLKKGTLIAFPSILEHRVTPVLAGVRKSATIWLSGPRFK